MLWDELQKIGDTRFSSIEELRSVIQPSKHTTETNGEGKKILRSVLQTRGQLERGVKDVVMAAERDNVMCM
jgi:Mg2+/Co2+ transporter CorB